MNVRLLFGLCLSLAVTGCDNPMNPGLLDFGPGGPGSDGNQVTDGGATDGPSTLDGPMLNLDLGSDPNGPMITIVSPVAVSGTVDVIGGTLKVTATVVPQGAPVAADTVKLLIPTANGGAMSYDMSLSGMANTYAGQADISMIQAGSSNFMVTAKDTMGRVGSATLAFVHDPGPVFTFLQPTAPTARGSITVEVLITDPLGHGVPASNVLVGIRAPNDISKNFMVDPTQDGTPGKPFHATAVVDFSTFSPALDGPQLILASAQSSSGAVTHAQKAFTVDNTGPSITIDSPGPGDFLGGVVEVKATITDVSGVQDSTVVAEWGNDPAKTVALTRLTGDSFHGFFDVRQFGRGYVLPTLSVRADDQLGNHGEVGIDIVVDNTPPHLEMDPPKIRVGQIDGTTQQVQCSALFDPLGDEAVNDGAKVQQVFTPRVRIQDDGNDAPGLLVVRFSGVDPNSVFLYASPASNGPLIVDTDTAGEGLGYCDSINPNLQPISGGMAASGQALALKLINIPPAGGGDFTSTTPPAAPNPYLALCPEWGIAGAQVPPPVCSKAGTDLTDVIGYEDTGVGHSAIWTIPPLSPPDYTCLGLQLDSSNQLPEGPTCLAVVARDRAGNQNVSPPIRVCIERTPGFCSSWAPANYPNCTGTYVKSTGTTNNTACAPLKLSGPTFDTRFPSAEVVLPP
jgi:hypothetical protein